MRVWSCEGVKVLGREGARVCRCEGVKAGDSLPAALQKRLLRCWSSHVAHLAELRHFISEASVLVSPHFGFCWNKITRSNSQLFRSCYVGCFWGVCGSPPGCVACGRCLMGCQNRPRASWWGVGNGRKDRSKEQAPARSVREPGGRLQSL